MQPQSEQVRNAVYIEMNSTGLLSKKREAVYECLKQLQRATEHEVAAKLNVPLHQVSGRITELRNLGKIQEWGTKINPVTKKPNTIYSCGAQSELFSNPKEAAKHNKAIKLMRLFEKFTLYPDSTDEYKINEIKKVL